MRAPLRRNRAQRQTAIARSVPAPVGGWDTESPLAAMPKENAVILDNWIPRAGYVELRRGFTQQVSGFSDPVETLIAWRGDPSGDQLFAASGADLYDITDSGSLGSSAYGSAVNARWKYTNFSNDAGAFVIACNGAQEPLKYNGTAWSVTAITGSSGPITLDPEDLADVMSHKRRLFFIENGTLRVWYLDVNAIAGAAGLLDLGPIFYKGGQLVAEATWSLDGGQGVDDMAVFVTTEGQVAVYQGTDPSDADNWALVGVYDLAKPVGSRCVIKWGSDLAILTSDGIVPLSQALSRDRAMDDDVAITARIRTAFSMSAGSYGGLFGWEMILYPGTGSLAIVNVPTAELSTSVQYVQSIGTGAWCRFTGLPAICWEYANGKIYFGSPDAVYEWDAGSSDNGEMIVGDMKPAFQGFGNRLQEKQFTMIRPLMKAPAIVQPALEINVDYKESIPTAVPTIVSAGDIEPTDPDAIRYDWTTAGATGYVAAPRMRLELRGSSEVSRLAVGPLTDLLLTAPGGDHLLERPSLPLDVSVQVIAFDLMFQPGGQL
jgi:hypothetical protein